MNTIYLDLASPTRPTTTRPPVGSPNLFLFNKSLKDLLFFIEKIIYTSSNSSHKSLKKNISSLILNSKTTKLKETSLLDVVGKLSFSTFQK